MLRDVRDAPRPICVDTAGGTVTLDQMATLDIGRHTFDGYVNRHMDTTLLSEGTLRQAPHPARWKFYGLGQKIVVSPLGPFIAEQRGTLDFWPTTRTGGGAELNERTWICSTCSSPTQMEGSIALTWHCAGQSTERQL